MGEVVTVPAHGLPSPVDVGLEVAVVRPCCAGPGGIGSFPVAPTGAPGTWSHSMGWRALTPPRSSLESGSSPVRPTSRRASIGKAFADFCDVAGATALVCRPERIVGRFSGALAMLPLFLAARYVPCPLLPFRRIPVRPRSLNVRRLRHVRHTLSSTHGASSSPERGFRIVPQGMDARPSPDDRRPRSAEDRACS